MGSPARSYLQEEGKMEHQCELKQAVLNGL